MVKRVVDTAFWTDMQVIDNYSVEDKYFSLYLMTNEKCTQVGIYSLPKKVMSFETGFTTEVIQVLIDRFSKTYNKILYSEKTQEITLLNSLEVSVLTGGKPVSDLLERELSNVKDADLILATYKQMNAFWSLSKRKFDQTIKELFEKELELRGLFITNQNGKQKHTQIHNHNESHSHSHIQSHNHSHNHNQDSYTTTRGTTREEVDETAFLKHYVKYLENTYPDLVNKITPNEDSITKKEVIKELHKMGEHIIIDKLNGNLIR